MAGKNKGRVRARAALLLACLATAQTASAGDPSARDWIPAPVGTNIIAGYLAGLRSSGLYSAGQRIGGASVDVDALIYRQMHYRELFGKTVQLEFIVPMTRTTMELPGASRDRQSGIGDVTLGSAIWLYNNEQTKTWFAWEPFVVVPVGRYDGSRPTPRRASTAGPPSRISRSSRAWANPLSWRPSLKWKSTAATATG